MHDEIAKILKNFLGSFVAGEKDITFDVNKGNIITMYFFRALNRFISERKYGKGSYLLEQF